MLLSRFVTIVIVSLLSFRSCTPAWHGVLSLRQAVRQQNQGKLVKYLEPQQLKSLTPFNLSNWTKLSNVEMLVQITTTITATTITATTTATTTTTTTTITTATTTATI